MAGKPDLFSGVSSGPAPSHQVNVPRATPGPPAPAAPDTSTLAGQLAAFRAVADTALPPDPPRDASDSQIAIALTAMQARACSRQDVRYLYGVAEKLADVQLHCMPQLTPTSAPPTIADRARWWQTPGGNYRVIVNVMTRFQDGSTKYRTLTAHWQGHWFLATWADLSDKISPVVTTRPSVPVAANLGPETRADADGALTLAAHGRSLAYALSDVDGLDLYYADHRSPEYQADKANIEAGMPGSLMQVLSTQQDSQPDGTVLGKAVFLINNDRTNVAATLRWMPDRQRWLVVSQVTTYAECGRAGSGCGE
jgi:hypothetical protein